MTTGTAADDAAAVEQVQAELDAARDKIANLEVALTSNRRIGIAIGIVMCQHRVTEQEAFAKLIAVSQRSHRKIRELAEDVVLTGTLPA